MKRTMTGILAVVVAGALIASPALAQLPQGTIGIYADFGEGLESAGITKPGTPFDVVVVADTWYGHGAMEFVMTELMHLYEGVFKFTTQKINNTTLDLGDNQNGEYLMAYGVCVPAGETEMVRVRYYDLNGEIGENVVLALRGFVAGDSRPSTFDGAPGYVSCDNQGYALSPEPWDAATNLDPTRIPGVESTDGIVVLNPTGLSVPVADTSVGTLKGRY